MSIESKKLLTNHCGAECEHLLTVAISYLAALALGVHGAMNLGSE